RAANLKGTRHRLLLSWGLEARSSGPWSSVLESRARVYMRLCACARPLGALVCRSGRSWVEARPAWRRCPAPPVWRGRAVQRAAASGSPCRARGRVVTSPSPRIQRIRSHGSRSAPMPKSKLVASPLAARLSAPFLALVLAALALSAPAEAQSRRLHQLLDEVTAEVEANRKLTQVMVDKIFSFSELGF